MEKTYYCPICGCSVKKKRDGSFFCAGGGHVFDSEEELNPRAKAQKSAAAAPAAAPAAPAASTAPASTGMGAEEIYAQNCNGVVEVLTEISCASGFIISKKGLVLTNAHAVLNDNNQVCSRVAVKYGSKVIPAHVIALGDTDNNNPNNVDLALLVMESVPADAVALKLGSSSKMKIGQHVYYIGNSKGEGLCMTAGIISDVNRQRGRRYFLMTDAATNPGNSGGPLFNDNGAVIGVHVSARTEAVGMKYSIPMDTARLFLNTVEDKLQVPHNTLADKIAGVKASGVATESLTAGLTLTLVLSGISLLVKNIEFIKEIVDSIRGV